MLNKQLKIITIYNTVILVRSVINFVDRTNQNFIELIAHVL